MVHKKLVITLLLTLLLLMIVSCSIQSENKSLSTIGKAFEQATKEKKAGAKVEKEDLSIEVSCDTVDFNSDGLVDTDDYTLFESNFMRKGCREKNNWCDGYDVDKSGKVDYGDFSYFVPWYHVGDCGEEITCSDVDYDGDGFVYPIDLIQIVNRGGKCIGDEEYDVIYDLDKDGCITETDYNISLQFEGQECGVEEEIMNLSRLFNMCFDLNEDECNQYKIDFIKQVVDQYTSYHNNYDSLISQYNEDVLFINWDDECGVTSPSFHIEPPYPYSILTVNNTEHDRIYDEFENRHLILYYKVHGYPRVGGFGLKLEDVSTCDIYTTNEELINFSFTENTPSLFIDSTTCGNWILWNPGQTFCCWPQATLISGTWSYFYLSGGYEVMNNFKKYFASEGLLGKSLLRTARNDWYFQGDITAHTPYAANLTPACGWADKQGIECICEPDETKNQLAIIIKENGIYDNSDLISSINSFISSIYLDLGISGNPQKFSGTTFEELDLFIEDLYYNSNVAYVILVGEDLPVTQVHPETSGIELFGAQELGIVNNSRIVPERIIYCYDVAISYIMPPLSPFGCKEGSFKCEEETLFFCDQNHVWVGEGVCECTPNEERCRNGEIEVCTNQGMWEPGNILCTT